MELACAAFISYVWLKAGCKLQLIAS